MEDLVEIVANIMGISSTFFECSSEVVMGSSGGSDEMTVGKVELRSRKIVNSFSITF